MSQNVMVVADLHLDRWLSAARDPFAALAVDTLSSIDALIVAGDLSDKPKIRWATALSHIARYMDLRRVWIVPGNHDYYHHAIDDDARLAAICDAAGANFAQKRAVVLGDTRYLCCTLWTDFALQGPPDIGMREAAQAMNDYRYIRLGSAGHRRIRPSDLARVHADHRDWLEAQLATPFDGKTVVVTHHAPLAACLPEGYPAAPAYASDLSPLIERHQPQAWLFGHSHAPVTLHHGSTVLRNVSLGYPDEVEVGAEAATLMPRLTREGAPK